MNVGELAQDVMAELIAGRELPNTDRPGEDDDREWVDSGNKMI
jgi:hypothetical protein